MRRMIAHRPQQGFMAIVLVVFLVVFVVIAASIVSMTTSGARGAADHVNASAALFMAESGIEWAARELFNADDPASNCAALEGQLHEVNDGGEFVIVYAEYLTEDEACHITSRGEVDPASRMLTGVIPKRVMDGDSGDGGDLFEDENAWHQSGRVEYDDGTLIFNRPGQGNSNTRANAQDVISVPFEAGETVYFAANIDWDADPTGNQLAIEIRNGIQIRTVTLPNVTGHPNAAPAGHPLYDSYNMAIDLGDHFSSGQITRIDLTVDWTTNPSQHVYLSNGCIGRLESCLGEGSDDPTDDGGWNEDP